MANIGSLVASMGVDTGALRGDLSKAKRMFRTTTTGINKALGSIKDSVFSLKGALVGLGGGLVAKSFVETAAGFETLQLSLDTITKGQGAEWFEKLNTWAMRMPVNTEKAIQTFQQLSAMGLKPTIANMTTLVDTTSAMGGGADVMQGIARALGQIQTKGKASAEELMQLAERGIPAYEILKQKLKLTAEQVSNIGNQGIKGSVAVKALLEGMDERFGGMASKMQSSWSGLIETVKSQWKEFQRVLMDAGPFNFLKSALQLFSMQMDDVLAGKGDMAQEFGEKVTRGIKTAIKAAALLKDSFFGLGLVWNRLKSGFFKFVAAIWEGLNKIREAVTVTLSSLNVMGALDKQVANSKRVQGEQLQIIMELKDQIADLAMEYTNLTKQETAFAQSKGMIKKIEENAKAMDAARAAGTVELRSQGGGAGAGGGDTGETGGTMGQAKELSQLEKSTTKFIENTSGMWDDYFLTQTEQVLDWRSKQEDNLDKLTSAYQGMRDKNLISEGAFATKTAEFAQSRIEMEQLLAAQLAEIKDEEHSAFLTQLKNKQSALEESIEASVMFELEGAEELALMKEELALEELEKEKERLELQYEDQLTMLNENLAAQAVLRSAHLKKMSALEDLEGEHQKSRDKLIAKSRLDTLKWFGSEMIKQKGSVGKAGVAIEKAMAIREAIINTFSMAVKSYNALAMIPIVGPILGAVAAAAAIAFGFVQISKITSARSGMDSVGSDQMMMIHAQERIVPGETNKDLTGFLKDANEPDTESETDDEEESFSGGSSPAWVINIDGAEFARGTAEMQAEAKGDKVNFG